MGKIKIDQSGWNAVIARDFTVDNVAMVSLAVAQWLNRKYKNPVAVLGFDTRFNSEMFMEAVAKVLASKGIQVFLPERYVTLPMVSYGMLKIKANCAIMITACNSPAEYNGIHFIGDNGGDIAERDLKDIESLISNDLEIDLDLLNWNSMLEQGLVRYFDLEGIYYKELTDNFNIAAFQNSGLNFAFDAMYGSVQNILRRLFPETLSLHCEINPYFGGITPNPLKKNLHELIELSWGRKDIDCCVALDGCGERMALLDKESNYYDANMILLLIVYYLAEYKKLNGKIAAGYAITAKIEKLCSEYNLELVRTKEAFPDILKLPGEEELIVAGDESGRIICGDHICAPDGLWGGLLICQWLVESGKTLAGLWREVTEITGKFSYERAKLELDRNTRNKIIEQCANGNITSLGRFEVKNYEIFDGFKFFLGDNEWFMIRSSANDPVVRLYAEADNEELAQEIIFSGIKRLMEV